MESLGQFLIKKLKFWGFVLLLIIAYITNRLNTERILSNNVKASRKLEDTILEYKLLRARLMLVTSKKEMQEKAKVYGLKELKEPPIKITVK